MAQENIWESEYKRNMLVTLHDEPQKFFLRYLKYLKKEKKFDLENSNVLDLGSGTGRNSNFLSNLGAMVWGIEISKTAVDIAKERAKLEGLNLEYLQGNIGDKLDFKANFFDLVIDITSSNSLSDNERDVYLSEVARVIKPGGYFFVRALCRDGDKNAKELIKKFPGRDHDTYVMPDLKLEEKVFTESSFREKYSKYFKIIELKKETGYTHFNGKKYKRNFWLAYLEL